MSCERYREAIADRAAGAPGLNGLEDHLAACGECREMLEALRRVLALADTELEDFAAADPSPALAARIRQAIVASHHSLAWPVGWLWPGVAAAAVLVASILWWARDTSPARPARTVTSAVTPRLPHTHAAAGATATTSARRAAEAAAALERRPSASVLPSSSISASRAARLAAPEVLVPPGEERALLRFVALVHRERLAPGALAASGEPSPEMAEIAPLEIAPLETVPLDPADPAGT